MMPSLVEVNVEDMEVEAVCEERSLDGNECRALIWYTFDLDQVTEGGQSDNAGEWRTRRCGSGRLRSWCSRD